VKVEPARSAPCPCLGVLYITAVVLHRISRITNRSILRLRLTLKNFHEKIACVIEIRQIISPEVCLRNTLCRKVRALQLLVCHDEEVAS